MLEEKYTVKCASFPNYYFCIIDSLNNNNKKMSLSKDTLLMCPNSNSLNSNAEDGKTFGNPKWPKVWFVIGVGQVI